MKILFLSRWFPYPPNNGSKIRVFNLLEGLSQIHSVTLISFFNPKESASGREDDGLRLQDLCLVPYHEFEPRSRRALLGFFSSTPRSIIDTHSTEMEELIRREIKGTRYDLVIASGIEMASYHRCFRGVPALFEEAELGAYWQDWTRTSSPWTGMRRRLTWAKHREFMSRVLRNFRMCTVVSEVERNLLARVASAFDSVHVIPNSIDLKSYEQVDAIRAAGSMIFTGSLRYFPNHHAMIWFLGEIFPRIRSKIHDARLTITGDEADQPLPSACNVTLTGHVNDVRPLVASASVSLAPIRIGGGTRLKILESMALCTPVVATSKGAEGLEVQHDRHLLIADTPNDFADAVIRLLREPELGRRLAENAFRLLEDRYDWRVVMPRFINLVDQAACG